MLLKTQFLFLTCSAMLNQTLFSWFHNIKWSPENLNLTAEMLFEFQNAK